MATVVAAIIVFGIVGLDVWYLIHGRIRRKGVPGCSCGGSCNGCDENCSGCGSGCH